MEILIIIARIALSLQFLRGGLRAARRPQRLVPKAQLLRLPAPQLMVRLNGSTMVLGAVLVATGIFPRVGAALVIATLIPVTLAGHQFWKEETEAGRDTQLIQALKNTGLAGGMLMVAAIADQPSIVSLGDLF